MDHFFHVIVLFSFVRSIRGGKKKRHFLATTIISIFLNLCFIFLILRNLGRQSKTVALNKINNDNVFVPEGDQSVDERLEDEDNRMEDEIIQNNVGNV